MKTRQFGFTLIELMIGLLLSSLLIAAVGKIFIDSDNSFRKQRTLSYLIEDGRFVQEVLARELRRLGFLKNRYAINGTATDIFNADNDVLDSGIDLASEEYIRGQFDKNGLNDAFDINHLVFRYQLNDINDLASTDYAASPCTLDITLTSGEDPASQRIVVTLYFYVKFDATINNPVLYCKAKRENLDDTTKNTTSNAMPIISNIEKLYLTFGIDTDNDGYANQYLRADQVTNSDWKNNIASIRFYLVLGSEEKNVAKQTPAYTLDGRTFSVNSAADKRFYKVFTSTIAFRNHRI